MWPLTAREVIEACGATCADPGCRGLHGMPCAALLSTVGDGLVRGATGSLSDLQPGDLFLALPFVNGDAHACVEEALSSGAALALVSTAWGGRAGLADELRRRCAVVPDVVTAFRAFAARFRERLSCPVAAVAGSNGKTTTKDMLAALLSSPGRRVVKTPGTDNGFLGLPQTLCSRAHRASSTVDAVVLEIGIDAPGAMEQHARMIAPDIVVMTALGPEHLGGFGDVATAVREELLLLGCAPAARRVLPMDDPEIRARPSLLRRGDVAVVAGVEGAGAPEGAAVLRFDARLAGAESVVEMWYRAPDERGSPARRLELRCPLPGAHNARNLALAAAAALCLGRSPEELAAGWRSFEPPPFRSRVVPLARGALLLDDCFNASPLSMRAALEALRDPVWAGRPKVVVLGDMLDLGGESEKWHLDLAGWLSEMEGVRACLFGAAMGVVAARLASLGEGETVDRHMVAGDPVELVAGMEVPEGGIVLVKGSRRMRLERVVHHLELRWARDRRAAIEAASRWVTLVAVTGSGREAVASAVAAALRGSGRPVGYGGETGIFVGDERVAGRRGGEGLSELLFRSAAAGAGVAVVSLRHGELLSAAEDFHFEVVVHTGLSAGDLPSGVDAETHLAHVAQLVVRGGGPRALVLCDGDPGCDLLAEVAPAGTQVRRYGDPAEAARLSTGAL